ncbi:MAG: diaminopimelate epimerase [Bdellovibrionales bacterium]
MRFIKCQATGNDFLIADLLTDSGQFQKIENRNQWARTVCDRHFGLGADGLIFIERSIPPHDFRWDFYNSDGSAAEMCGNAARAVALWASQKLKKSKMCWESVIGTVSAQVGSADDISIQLPEVKEAKLNLTLPFAPGVRADFVLAGVPHVVIHDVPPDQQAGMALKVKRMDEFLATGTNVTFIKAVAPSRIESRSFERGVEDFTLSCGTGAIAAAFSFGRGQCVDGVEVRVPGGSLHVLWENKCPVLKGPARLVAAMEWFDEES